MHFPHAVLPLRTTIFECVHFISEEASSVHRVSSNCPVTFYPITHITSTLRVLAGHVTFISDCLSSLVTKLALVINGMNDL